MFPAISLGFTIFFSVPSKISGFHHSFSSSPSSAFLAISLGFTILLLLRFQLYLWSYPFFFCFCVPSYFSEIHHLPSSSAFTAGVHHSSTSVFPAISLGSPFWVRFCVCDPFFNPTIEGVTFRLRFQFTFSFSSRWHRSARKTPYALRPVSHKSPQGCPRNSANICLVEHRSFSTLEGGMSAASFLHSSFLQAINAVMPWLVHVQKVLQASEHFCPAKLQNIIMCYLLCLPVYLPVHSH